MSGTAGESTGRRGRVRPRSRTRARTALLLLFLALCATVMAAPGSHAAPGDGAPAASPSGRAAYLAAQLRESPVHVSDQIPRSVPRSAAPDYREQAERTGVPTYVLVLPGETLGAQPEGLLAAVHDRLGRDGLYVLLPDNGIGLSAATFGVDAPARSAVRATLHEMPYDAGALHAFTRFVDVLVSGDREAARRAEAASERYAGGDSPDGLHTSPAEREDQSLLTGLLLTGVPLLLLLLGRMLRHGPGGRWARARYVVPLAAVSVLVIALGAPRVFGETRSSSDPPPTAEDMRARTERVTDGLRGDPVYADAESAPDLSAAQRAELSKRVRALDVPVLIAVVPMVSEDESAGDGDLFAATLHRSLGKDAVYVVAAPDARRFAVVNHGARLGERLYDYTEEMRYGPDSEKEREDPDLYGQLTALLAHIEDMPQGPPGSPYLDAPPAADPVEEEALPSLYSGAVWGGAMLGALAAALMLGLTAAVHALLRHLRGRRAPASPSGKGRGSGASGGPGPSGRSAARVPGVPDAPARPGTGWLRRTARRELDEMNTEFGRLAADCPDDSRKRAWRCLDAATLLLDQEGDQRVDAGADAATLATAVVLLRAGRAALTGGSWRRGAPGAAERLCSLNPLHGPATGSSKFRREGMDRARQQSVCAGCRDALAAPETRETVLRTGLLRLRADGRRGPVPYDRLPGPMSEPAHGGVTTDHLVDSVLEHLGVH